MELKELRQQIDEIDRELVALFLRRMNCSAKIAEYKRNNKLPVLDSQREAALLERVSALSGEELSGYTAELYRAILSLSREYQQSRLDSEGQGQE